jgi:hypothetical protein
MKRLSLMSLGLIALLCVALFGQAPAGGQRGPGGGPGGPGGGGGQRRGGGGPAAAAPATGPVADATNKIVDAINKQDAAYFQKAMTADAYIADEDGHVGIPASAWVTRLTGAPKKLAITGLRVADLGSEAAYAVFSYTLDEKTAQGADNQMKGTATIIYKKSGADLQATFFQFSVNGRAVTPH